MFKYWYFELLSNHIEGCFGGLEGSPEMKHRQMLLFYLHEQPRGKLRKKNSSCFVVWFKVFKKVAEKESVFCHLDRFLLTILFADKQAINRCIVALHKCWMPLKTENNPTFILYYAFNVGNTATVWWEEIPHFYAISHEQRDRAASKTFIKYKRSLCSAEMLKYLEN